MKRPRNLDVVAPPRRKRALSGEELELWESVAKEAKPLRKKTRAVKQTAVPADEEQPSASLTVKVPKASPPPRHAIQKPPSPPPLAPLGHRERSQLSRGKKDIDARLDLHGMTQAKAHRALLNFLHHASDNGMLFVLVITGKGRTVEPGAERGLLRRLVPEWLGLPEFRSVVVGFEQAHIGHGGEGALYVRVRRMR